MSIAYQCDRCGKLVAIPDIKFHIPIMTVNIRDIYFAECRDLEKIQKLDLCSECNEELKTWIDAKKGEKNGRDVCTGAAKKGAGTSRRKTRKADGGDTPDEG